MTKSRKQRVAEAMAKGGEFELDALLNEATTEALKAELACVKAQIEIALEVIKLQKEELAELERRLNS